MTGGVFDLLIGRTERTLSIGLGALSGMSVSEFKAILAHEYGHFSNNDTAWNSLTFTNSGVLQNTLRNMPSPQSADEDAGGAYVAATALNPALWVLMAYSFLFSVFTNGFSRIGEVLADKNAVTYFGRKNFVKGLRKVSLNGLLFAQVADPADLAKKIIDENKVYTNLYAYLDVVKNSLNEETMMELEKQMIDSDKASLHDSHPLYRDRLNYVAHFDEKADLVTDDAIVTGLFENWDALSEMMSNAYNERIMGLLKAAGHSLDASSKEPEEVKADD